MTTLGESGGEAGERKNKFICKLIIVILVFPGYDGYFALLNFLSSILKKFKLCLTF
jgi:hypothetical protein